MFDILIKVKKAKLKCCLKEFDVHYEKVKGLTLKSRQPQIKTTYKNISTKQRAYLLKRVG